MSIVPSQQPEETFYEAGQKFDLDKLKADLDAENGGLPISDAPWQQFQGVLCGYTIKEIAEKLEKDENGLRVSLKRGVSDCLIQILQDKEIKIRENATTIRDLGGWTRVPYLLQQAGYGLEPQSKTPNVDTVEQQQNTQNKIRLRSKAEQRQLLKQQYGGREITDRLERVLAKYTNQLFVERSPELETLDNFITQTNKRFLLVTGGAGFGKTALLAHWILQKKNNCFFAYHFFNQQDEIACSISNAYRHLLRQLYIYYELANEALPYDRRELRELIYQLVGERGALEGESLVILFDGLDEADDTFEPPFPASLPKNVFVIASARAFENEEPEYLRGWTDQANRIQLYRLSVEAIKNWLQNAGKGELTQYSQDIHFVNQLDRITQGFPLYLQYLIDDLIAAAKTGQDLWEVLNDTPNNFEQYVEQQLKRLDSLDLPEKRWQLFALLAIAKGWLNQADIKALTGMRDRELRQLRQSWQVTRWLQITGKKDATDYAFTHPLLGVTFAKVLGDDAEDALENVLDYCAKWQENKSIYALRYYAQHLAAGKKEELRQLLFDFQWLEAKLNATDVNASIADYELLSGDRDLQLIQEAIQLSAYTLRYTSGKNQLASQLIGRLLSFDSPQIQTFLKQAKPSTDIPWIRPLTASLIPPGGPLLRTLVGHKHIVSAIAITPDGKHIVSGSGDGTIKIWDFKTGNELKTITGHNGSISAVAITPDGKYIVSSSEDKTIKIWYLSTGKIVRTLTGHEDRLYGIAISSDGKKVVSSSGDNTVRCWNLETGQELWTTKQSVRSKFIATLDCQSVIFHSMQIFKILDLQTGKVIQTINGYNSENSFICRMETNKAFDYIVYALTENNTLKVFDLNTGEEKSTLKGHKCTLNMVFTITPDGRQIISGSFKDQMIKIWDLETGEELRTLTQNNREISAIAITPDGKSVVTGSWDMTIKIWDLHSTEQQPKFPGHDDAVSAVAISPDGRLAFSGSQDATIKIWDLAERKEIQKIQTNYPIFDFGISSDTKRAFFKTGKYLWEENLRFYEITNDREGELFDHCLGHLRAVSSTGRFAISDSFDWERRDDSIVIQCWDLTKQEQLWQLPVGISFRIAEISANEKFAITAAWDGTVVIWDLCNQQELWNFNEIHEELEVVAISPTGKIAASASNIFGNSLIIRDLITGKKLHNDDYIRVPMGISKVAMSSDDKLLICSGHSRLTVWNLETLEVITTFNTEGDLPALAVAPDNRTIIVGEESGRLHFLRLEGL